MEGKIFTGKGAKNNELILKLLYEKGYLTPWKIANELALLDPKKPKDTYHKAQKIQSVLIRKNGRLEDLIKKDFIEKTEKGCCLTFEKGFCSALTLYKEIPKPAIDEATKIEAILPELREMLDAMIRYQPQAQLEAYKIMKEITNDLLKKGLNLEKISNNEFNRFYADQYEELQLKELKKVKKNEEKCELPPELKEATNKFISRLLSIAQKQFKELEDLQQSYFQDNQKDKLQENK
jgi:hypothetical protein